MFLAKQRTPFNDSAIKTRNRLISVTEVYLENGPTNLYSANVAFAAWFGIQLLR